MVTKAALVGLAHFLLQAEPRTAQNVMNQLDAQDSKQVMEIMQEEDQQNWDFPMEFRERVKTNSRAEPSAPSHETSQPGPL